MILWSAVISLAIVFQAKDSSHAEMFLYGTGSKPTELRCLFSAFLSLSASFYIFSIIRFIFFPHNLLKYLWDNL